MILYNKTQKKIISKNLKIAKTFFDNLFGLTKEKENNAMLFKTRFGIHTFFMKYPIDIIVLDKNNKIVKIKKNLKPNKLFFWNPKFNKIIESVGINNSSKLNDEIEFKRVESKQ